MSVSGITRLSYSPEEAAATHGVSRAFIYKMLADGRLPSFKLGRSRRIPASALQALGEPTPPSGSTDAA